MIKHAATIFEKKKKKKYIHIYFQQLPENKVVIYIKTPNQAKNLLNLQTISLINQGKK